ncbi:2'-5' RNA ligase family protein [Leifsonia sp. TF02-11]|uniref:2'-5' RNA ligase family protein n=1 Tax=Leifsonia sp. TF02-11 TaxID=2815212 RepID=UPI001AA12496|nr:2'-5' RNA ligase family protein [Leifsonia sp. TF02-11]MBO1738826.1 2'-5' RNA ligase family protein [Leifsonia sp. TF02-11]
MPERGGDVVVPAEFAARDWPLHVTIVPPFETGLDAGAIAALLPRGPRIPVVAGARASFGHRRAVPVTLIRPSPALLALHLACVEALEAAGAVIADRRHIRSGYRPHASDQRLGTLAPGEHASLTELALVERTPGAPRRVVARIPLA